MTLPWIKYEPWEKCPWTVCDRDDLPVASFETPAWAGKFVEYLRDHPGADHPPKQWGVGTYTTYPGLKAKGARP